MVIRGRLIWHIHIRFHFNGYGFEFGSRVVVSHGIPPSTVVCNWLFVQCIVW